MTYVEKYGKPIKSVDYGDADVTNGASKATVTYIDGEVVIFETEDDIRQINVQVYDQHKAIQSGEVINWPLTK